MLTAPTSHPPQHLPPYELPHRPLSDADLDDLAVTVASNLDHDLDTAVDLMPHQYQRMTSTAMSDGQADRLKSKVLDRCVAEYGGRLPLTSFTYSALVLDQAMVPEDDGRFPRAIVYGFMFSLPLWALIVVLAKHFAGGQ